MLLEVYREISLPNFFVHFKQRRPGGRAHNVDHNIKPVQSHTRLFNPTRSVLDQGHVGSECQTPLAEIAHFYRYDLSAFALRVENRDSRPGARESQRSRSPNSLTPTNDQRALSCQIE